MTVQRINRIVTCYRIGDPEGNYPIYDATGSTISPGRWNTSNAPCIYASEHYSTAILEKLAHGNGHLPPNQHSVTITVPTGMSYEMVTRDSLPGWDYREPSVSKEFGKVWLREKRSLILIVPSYVARVERNMVINPLHPEFQKIDHTLPEPVWWDDRLFG
jgi:RES domain-containing protein